MDLTVFSLLELRPMSRKLGLIIGNSEYTDGNLAQLIAPSADVSAFAHILRAVEIGAFDEVTTLVNENSATIRRTIAHFFEQKNPDDLLLLYFSGHGVLDDQGQLYLAVKDTEHDLISGTAIPANFITGEMDRSRSRRQVLILDTCHSGAFARGTKGAVGEKVGLGVAFEGTGFGRVVLTATDATQYAWEGDQIIGEAENSVFTHFMIEGLQTGSADLDGDGQVAVDELYDYIYEQVVKKTPKQTPGKWSYKQQGDIIIARNPVPVGKRNELAPELVEKMASPLVLERESAVRDLERLLNRGHPGLAQAAHDALKHLSEDDSRRVSSVAIEILAAYGQSQQRLAELYEQASKHARSEDWAKAFEAFQQLIAIDPNFRDAAAQLRHAQNQTRWAGLYAQGIAYEKAKQYRDALRTFESLQRSAGDHKDVNTRIAELKRKIGVTSAQAGPRISSSPSPSWLGLGVLAFLLVGLCLTVALVGTVLFEGMGQLRQDIAAFMEQLSATRTVVLPPTSTLIPKPSPTRTFAATALPTSSPTREPPTPIPPTLTPTVTPTQIPPTVPRPTLTPEPPPAPPPGIYVLGIRTIPGVPPPKVEVAFVVTFLNTTGKEQSPEWRIKIFQPGIAQAKGESHKYRGVIPPDVSELTIAGWSWGPGTPCTYFYYLAYYPNSDGILIEFLKPDGTSHGETLGGKVC